jgi:hypothetical protein
MKIRKRLRSNAICAYFVGAPWGSRIEEFEKLGLSKSGGGLRNLLTTTATVTHGLIPTTLIVNNYYTEIFMKIVILPFAIATMLMMSACSTTHSYKPDIDTYEFPSVTEFRSEHDVNVVNANQSNEPFLFGEAGMGNAHKWMGNLKEWTDVAVEITNRELSARGMTINPEAPKTLQLSILEAIASSGGWGFRGNISLKATTGDGFERVYQGESPAMMINRSADGAIMQAVAAMLRDENIINYLKE